MPPATNTRATALFVQMLWGMNARTGGLPVIVNAAAGRSDSVARAIGAALTDVGIAASVEVCAPAALAERLHAAVDDGADVIGVAGGDGTMRSAAQVLAGSAVALAPFPAGTLNHFTQRVGLRSAADTALALAAGRVRTIAAGRMDDDVFLNTATFGLYADVLRRRERLRSWLGKWPAAAVSFLVTLVQLRPVHLTLEAGGRSIQRDTALVWVGIGWGSFPAVHQAAERRATPDLEVAVLRDVGRLRLFTFGVRTCWRVLRGGVAVHGSALEVLHVRRLQIESRRGRVGITLDGEVMERRATASVQLEEGALRVLVGPELAALTQSDAAQSSLVNRRPTVR